MDRAEHAISQWATERPDLDHLPMAVLGRLAEASQLVSRDHLEPLFARFGLQAGEFDVLATLRRSGAPFALSPTALYQATMVTSGAMTGRLDRLEKLGFVARARNPNDRRGTLVELTKEGRDLIDKAIDAHVENEKSILSALKRNEQEQLNQLLAKVISSLGAEAG
ncbi:MarR family transcriptional regulator [Labrenzia sp. DG1229]|uniref:MarR family winged helix-turn-helix transcriptional regulator n=1 Tax=Labrenzia sp. DG1229 TaxID=681847 RepID=UPI00048E3523|nr:MarR family transcriptional regulator [Labrenzia sp. DG1229]